MSTPTNIPVYLDTDFISAYNRLQAKYGEDIAAINGFNERVLSYTDFIDNFIDQRVVADASIDGNSNVSHKDIVTLEKEMPKPHMKLLAFNKIFYEIKKEYGFSAANEWLEKEWVGELYLHDADSCTKKPYCFAYDLKDLAEKGLYFIEGRNAKPAQHLITFIDFIKEFISYASNRTSGAVGLPNILPYMWYFWNKDVKENYLLRDPEYYAKQAFQRFIYGVNQPYTRDGSQSAFTNTSVFDRNYYVALFGGSTFPDGSFMIDAMEDVMKFQKWYLEVLSAIREENMFTFPVNTISLLRDKKEGFKDEDFAKWAIRHNIKWSDSNLFIDDSVTSLSNCCRLKSDIKDLGYFNSIGGTALKVGSVKVGTINLARIALDSSTKEEYLKNLEERVAIDLKCLDRVRHIIKRNVEKGLLPNFVHGLIDFEHLYNTIGFIGIFETMLKFGFVEVDAFGNHKYVDEAFTFGQQIFNTMRAAADKFIADYGVDYMVNLEQVPGESAASKLMKKDKWFYPNADIYQLPLYGNQFIPLGVQATLQERIKIASKFDSYCNGGSILHISIDAPFDSFEKAWDMVNYIADQGVTYFAFNPRIQACKHNHGFYGTVCPKCGNPVAKEYTRIVGFFTATETWSKERKAEGALRKLEKVNNVQWK